MADVLKVLEYAATSGLGLYLGYLFGRKKEADKVRISQAFTHAGEIAPLLLDIHAMEEERMEWYKSNFTPQLTFEEAMGRVGRDLAFAADRMRIDELLRKRQALREKIRLARVYLNPKVMNRIDEYLRLGSFTFSHDGMGGILFDTHYWAFFNNLLDESVRTRKEALFQKIKARLNKMHQMGWF